MHGACRQVDVAEDLLWALFANSVAAAAAGQLTRERCCAMNPRTYNMRVRGLQASGCGRGPVSSAACEFWRGRDGRARCCAMNPKNLQHL